MQTVRGIRLLQGRCAVHTLLVVRYEHRSRKFEGASARKHGLNSGVSHNERAVCDRRREDEAQLGFLAALGLLERFDGGQEIMADFGTSKARQEAAVLVFVIFLVGVLLGSLGNHVCGGRVGEKQEAGRAAPPTRAQLISEFTREVGLTPDEQNKIGAIIDDTAMQTRALDAPLDAQREKILRQSDNRIRAMLAPEQWPRFE